MQKINELQLAKELIRFPSITPVDAGIMSFLEKKLKQLGFKTKVLEFREKNSKPVKNLYARLGSKSPNFCYAGHLDVVPAGNLKDWTVNPFKPSIKKGHLIGRGANDMKSSIAAFVSAISNFIENYSNFSGSISLLITGDEEGAAINGTKKVVEYLKKRKEKIDFCLVGEPTNPSKLGEMIKIGRRGSMNGRLTITGVQGHVAYPHRANNPSTALVQILKEIKDRESIFEYLLPQLQNIKSLEAAFSMALWDWWSQRKGKTVYNMLGADKKNISPTSYTIGITKIDDIEEKIIESEPYRILKVKLGTKNDKKIIITSHTVLHGTCK